MELSENEGGAVDKQSFIGHIKHANHNDNSLPMPKSISTHADREIGYSLTCFAPIPRRWGAVALRGTFRSRLAGRRAAA